MPAANGRVEHPDSEFRLLCLVCGIASDAELSPMLQRIDVARFLDLAIGRHRVGPLVAARLRGVAGVPADLGAALAGTARANRLRHLQAVRSHLLLDRWLSDAGVPWLPFKGVTLASRYYPEPASRQVNDLDLWVPAAQLEAARAVLAREGFRVNAGITPWALAERGPRHRAFLQRWQVEETHLHREHGSLDLHWQLSDNPALFRLADEALLIGLESIDLGGRSLPAMRHEDLLLYLCEHGGKHGWFRLKWLIDLPRVLDHRPLDWPALFARARELGCERSLLLGLALAERLLQWSPPPEVAVRSGRFRHRRLLLALVDAQLRDPAIGVAHHATTSRRLMLMTTATRLLLAGQWPALRHALWRLSLSPLDLQVLPLPDRWLPLYRVLRPLLLIWRRGCHRWQRLRRV